MTINTSTSQLLNESCNSHHFGNRPQIPCQVPFQDHEYTPSAFNYPFVSCQTYVIMDTKKNKILFSKKSDEIREMASLTKIMTMMVSLHLCAELKINMHKTWFRVSALAASMIGTTANLTENQRISIYDLLHAMMLPSGNDAAMTLAEGFSELIRC